MNQKDEYKTKPRLLIEETAERLRSDFTIKELFAAVQAADQSVGLTTVYRTVDRLVESRRLVKILDQDSTVRYRYQEECGRIGHCFLKCKLCGAVQHADCLALKDLEDHFLLKHQFLIERQDITIYGYCQACLGKVKNEK